MSLSNHAQGHNDAPITELEADMIRDAARSFASSESPLSVVRNAEAGDWSAAKDSWPKLAGLGWLDLLQYKETEREGMIAACIIAEELGRAAYPMPFAEMAVAVLPLLAQHAPEHADLAALTEGKLQATLALPLSGIPTSASRLPTLDGEEALMANQLQHSDLLLLPVRDQGQVALAIIKRPTQGWQSQPQPDLANNAYQPVDRKDLTDAILISLDWAELAKIFDHFKLVTASYVVGLASQATDISVEYAKERIAFDKPIGSFQAVQQRLAESALELAAAHFLIQEASVTGERSQIPMACIQTCEAGKKATFTAQQIWGGMGYTLEVDVQLFFRRARAYQLLLGTPWELRERIWDEVVPQH